MQISESTVSAGLLPAPNPLKTAAKELETAFLSEMLKAANFAVTPSAFGGGIGEDQFASLLRESMAREMVEAGGVGLAERLFASLNQGANR